MAVTKETVFEFGWFALAQLAEGKTVEHLGELLEDFEVTHRSPEMVAMDEAAIRAALRDYDGGERGRPFEEFEAEFRSRYGITAE